MTFLILAMLLAPQTPQEDAAATEAINTFDAAFQQKKDPTSRSALISKLAATRHEKVVAKLAGFLSDAEKAIRFSAAHGLAGYVNASAELKKSASHALTSALSSGVNARDPESMETLFAAIGNLQEESAGSTLKAHYEDKDAKIAGAAVSASGALKSKTLIEPLIELLRECEKAAKPPPPPPPSTGKTPKTSKSGGGGGGGSSQPDPDAAKRERANSLLGQISAALTTLTAQSFPNSGDWDRWWSKNRSSFTVPK